MRISDWISDVCSSDLVAVREGFSRRRERRLLLRSFETVHVRDEGPQFAGGEGGISGHLHAGLQALRVGDPASQCSFVVGEDSGSEVQARGDMGEVGAGKATRASTAHLVTASTEERRVGN